MYCRYCGKEIMEKAVVCAGCGHPIYEDAGEPPRPGEPWHWLVMVGLVAVAVLAFPLGLFFGIIGLRDEAKKVQGAVLTTVSVIMALLMLAIISGL
ncbi:Zinc ribbon protein [Candidatus Methylocalor cossyra]|uniref:Zinc ribbon protein n=2 Tax=Candidatus Methylocalor cossyra TaxID=3108543 RepID=A0ABM9NEY7_9GAMM